MTGEFRVGDWLVEPQLNRAVCAAGTVAIQPKIVEVLAFLADHPGEVLSKQTIIRAVWPGTYVSDDALTYSISELRKALGDDSRRPRIIQTIPRRGYRLIAPVKKTPTESGNRPSVAVLPFTDMSPEKDQEYFCDGIAEEITNKLAQLENLRVAARTSSFAFKGKSEDVRAIGRKLAVSAVLEGSVRKACGRLRITAQLIDVDSGFHLWSDRYDREFRDIFVIQDGISRSIASALKITLTPRQKNAMQRDSTADHRAYDYYLRGRQFFYQYKRQGIEFASQMFARAIEMDPNYARAHAGLADCSAYLYMYAGGDPIQREKADTCSLNAVELDPDSAEARASRGVALSLRERWAEAEREFEEAIILNPFLFEAYYFCARVAFAQGKLEQAIQFYERAAEVNPQDYQAPLLAAQSYRDLGRHEEADAASRRGIRAVEERLKMNPDDARALYMGANGLVALGEFERGLRWAEQALEMDPDEPMVLYNVACIQALAGRIEAALGLLERAVQCGLVQKEWIEHDSNLDPLRGHPRYQSLIQRLAGR